MLVSSSLFNGPAFQNTRKSDLRLIQVRLHCQAKSPGEVTAGRSEFGFLKGGFLFRLQMRTGSMVHVVLYT
jgi:hypothetical protein